ncbi:MAG: ABC transporter permease [Clostridiales Family XIII bacterium]|jgi:ABC-2 type transport system permease protein|nr:ABC transporter permease [Clostridiales Family XIII bacterium]
MNGKTGVLFGRLMRHILRSPDTIITVAITPIAIMLMFVYVFGGAITASLPSGVNYVNYQLPGILLMAINSGISYTAFRMFGDRQSGIFSRFHSMPIRRSSALWAHVFVSLVSNMLTVAIIFLVALPMGFRSSAGILEWLSVAGILALFTLALTWVAVIPGLVAKSAEGASVFSYPLIFLPMFSSAFAPTETMPAAVRWFAENQPITSIVETLRSLLNAEPAGNEIWIALAWCAGIALVAYFFAMRAYGRA